MVSPVSAALSMTMGTGAATAATAFPVTTFPVTTFPVTTFALTAFALTAFALTAFPVTAFPVTAFPVTIGIVALLRATAVARGQETTGLRRPCGPAHFVVLPLG